MIAAEAVGVYTQVEILDAIQRGCVSLQFVSPAQVDGRGNLNTSRVRGADGTMRRLPGGLAHADIACLIGRLVAYRAGNDKRFLPEEVDFVTGAAGRVATIVTAAAVLDWDGERFRLASVHAGVTRDEAVAGCGFALDAPGARARHRAAAAGGAQAAAGGDRPARDAAARDPRRPGRRASRARGDVVTVARREPRVRR